MPKRLYISNVDPAGIFISFGGVILDHSDRVVFMVVNEPSNMGTETINSSGRSTRLIAITEMYIITAKMKIPWNTSVHTTPYKPLATV